MDKVHYIHSSKLRGSANPLTPSAIVERCASVQICNGDLLAMYKIEHPSTQKVAKSPISSVQRAEDLARVIAYVQIPIETLRQQNPQIARAIDFLNEVGYTTDIAALRKQHPSLMDFDTWLQKEGKATLPD